MFNKSFPLYRSLMLRKQLGLGITIMKLLFWLKMHWLKNLKMCRIWKQLRDNNLSAKAFWPH